MSSRVTRWICHIARYFRGKITACYAVVVGSSPTLAVLFRRFESYFPISSKESRTALETFSASFSCSHFFRLGIQQFDLQLQLSSISTVEWASIFSIGTIFILQDFYLYLYIERLFDRLLSDFFNDIIDSFTTTCSHEKKHKVEYDIHTDLLVNSRNIN